MCGARAYPIKVPGIRPTLKVVDTYYTVYSLTYQG
jgi:hypothetical protein